MENELEERELKELELMNENENREFYVYEHIRTDNNTPFYIGKRTENRAYKIYRGEGTHHDNICKACGCKVVIIKDNLTENQAFKLENKMIEYYVHTLGYGIDIEGYDDYDHKLPHLTNRDWGGIGGKSGIKNTEEHNKNISEAMKGHVAWNKGKKTSEETKRKLSEKMKGEKHPLYSKHLSDETKEKIIEKLSKKVICITTGKIFDCIKDAGDYYKCSNIVPCCKGKRKSAGKLNGERLKWKYLENYNNEFKGILINPIMNKRY